MISVDTQSSGIIPAGYDPSCFDSDDDLAPISPSIARHDSLREVSDDELEELEEQALAEGKTPEELEALALNDELTASATEAALQLLDESLRELCCRHRLCPAKGRLACRIIHACFKRGAMQSVIKRLRRRCTRLRRAADRLMREEHRACIASQAAPSGSRSFF